MTTPYLMTLLGALLICTGIFLLLFLSLLQKKAIQEFTPKYFNLGEKHLYTAKPTTVFDKDICKYRTVTTPSFYNPKFE